ncbi:serine hydrolase [Sphingosinicella sp. CPCC 101087]|uniref:serine hydrolase n=1 Tax=Sphingosinicella sp. CPCC 101087 TaxID=2497754 RepID=UPI00101DEF9D|nr:serine hydrolase [Sphingosinicella sp. CPCC 101087]
MAGRWFAALLALVGMVALPVPAGAQAQPSPELRSRAEAVMAMLRGGGNPAEMFTPEFLAQIPEAQVRAIPRQLADQYGPVRAIAGIDAKTPTAGTLHAEFERAVLHIEIVIEPQAPHRISGLLVAGADVRGDTLDAVMAEVRALPGQVSVAVARLGDGAPEMLASVEPGRPLAIGSTFKLFILAELDRQIRAGERRWSDVVALDRRSVASGVLQNWPAGSPLTVHTLAALMISQSDNTATDQLLHLVGRENVERMMATLGVEAADRNRPFLSTLEVAALKAGPAGLLQSWRSADEAGRRRLLDSELPNVDAGHIELTRFTGAPLHIELVEWFASAADLVRTMDWLRRHGDDATRAILAINPGVGPTVTGGLTFVGYKGGSEPGVLNLTWLLRNRAGQWHVVTGSWNNPAATVEEARFLGLLSRTVQLVR